MDAVLDLPLDWHEVVDGADCLVFHVGKLSSSSGDHIVVAGAALEPGIAAAASLCSRMISQFCPRFLAMTGIAGGLKADTNFGDIVVADVVWDYTSGKFLEGEGADAFHAEPRIIDLDALAKSQLVRTSNVPGLVAKIAESWRGPKPDAPLKVAFGPMFCGSAVIASERYISLLRSMNRKIRAIDMESYGVSCAAKYSARPEPIALIVKSISDHADAAKNDDWHGYAAYTSAQFLLEWAKRFL